MMENYNGKIHVYKTKLSKNHHQLRYCSAVNKTFNCVKMCTAQNSQRAIENFRDYLKIPSVHPNVNYEKCIEFLTKQATELGLAYKVYYISSEKPVVVMTWKGTATTLPSIMLNSHMDVVPVYEEKWKHKPFGAEIDDGKIYARGTQDMKSIGIQYLEAIRALKQNNVELRRTIHVVFVPDEEIGGEEGMEKFVRTDYFKDLNIGFAMDEGRASKKEKYCLFYAEKCRWQFKVHCPGISIHGSVMERDTPGEKLEYMLHRIYEFRNEKLRKLEEDSELTTSDVISINVTIIEGGVQVNIVPPEFAFMVDCRIPPTTNMEEFESLLSRWCKEAGEGVRVEYQRKESIVEPTKLDESNVFWNAFREASEELEIELELMICPGTTDMRFVRNLGLPAIGFSPINTTPILAHAHDEYIRVDTFLRGIEIYEKILTHIGNA